MHMPSVCLQRMDENPSSAPQKSQTCHFKTPGESCWTASPKFQGSTLIMKPSLYSCGVYDITNADLPIKQPISITSPLCAVYYREHRSEFLSFEFHRNQTWISHWVKSSLEQLQFEHRTNEKDKVSALWHQPSVPLHLQMQLASSN